MSNHRRRQSQSKKKWGRLAKDRHFLSIRMVAGFAEVAERKEILVALAGFEPTRALPRLVAQW
jgi:hypothetical protein